MDQANLWPKSQLKFYEYCMSFSPVRLFVYYMYTANARTFIMQHIHHMQFRKCYDNWFHHSTHKRIELIFDIEK